MRNWALVAGVTAAVAAASVIVIWKVRHNQAGEALPDVSDVIEDCFDRIRQIEADLGKLRPSSELVQ